MKIKKIHDDIADRVDLFTQKHHIAFGLLGSGLMMYGAIKKDLSVINTGLLYCITAQTASNRRGARLRKEKNQILYERGEK